MGEWQSVALEIELTAGTWTNITPYLAYPLTIRQGRPTEFDDPSSGVMSFSLWNDDGRFMPSNTTSPLYPNFAKGKRVRWKVMKAGTTYTRFVGWIAALAPDFPTSSTTGSMVAVTAIDGLGKLSQRRLRSNLTERALWRARSLGVACDVWEADPTTSGQVATLTQHSPDAGAASPGTVWGSAPNLSFGSDNESSFGGVVTSSGRPLSNKTIAGLQAGHTRWWAHLLAPDRELTAGERHAALTVHSSAGGGAAMCHLSFESDGAGQNRLLLRNAANSATLDDLGSVRPGQWIALYFWVDATVTQSVWAQYDQSGAFVGSTASVALDIRGARAIEFPAGLSSLLGGVDFLASTSFGGCGGMVTSSLGWASSESFVGGSQGALSARIPDLTNAVSQLPVTISTIGTLTGTVATGSWSGRPASEVLQEMLRTHSGMAWARSRDSVVYAIGSDQLYPTAPLAVIDTDADCLGSPRLVDGDEARPTRIDVTWPGGTAVAIDTTAEAAGEARSRRVATVALNATDAKAVGTALLTRAAVGLRFSSIVVDLLGGKTDHTAALFSESGTLSGLFPTQRVRLAVPASHFGSSTRDVHVQSWVETYGPREATVTLDTTPSTDAAADLAYGYGLYGDDIYGA